MCKIIDVKTEVTFDHLPAIHLGPLSVKHCARMIWHFSKLRAFLSGKPTSGFFSLVYFQLTRVSFSFGGLDLVKM